MSLMIIILYLKELLNGELTVFFFIHDDFRDDDFFTESPWRLCLILCICSHSQVLAKMLKTHQNEYFQQILNKILCFTQEVTLKMKTSIWKTSQILLLMRKMLVKSLLLGCKE